MKPIEHWLRQLPPGYRGRALRNYRKAKREWPKYKTSDLADAIMHAFSWDESPEGCDFWDKVYQYSKHTLPPLPKPKRKATR